MLDDFDTFLKIADNAGVGDILLKQAEIKQTCKKAERVLEDFAQSIGEHKKKIEKPAKTKTALPPTYAQSVLDSEEPSLLYDVTNTASELPTVEKRSSIFKHLRYSIRGLTSEAYTKQDNNRFSLYIGEKEGFGFRHDCQNASHQVTAQYNIRNKKSKLEYSYSWPHHSLSINVASQKGTESAGLSYKNNDMKYSFSVNDEKSAAASAVYKQPKTNISFGVYGSTDAGFKNPTIGIIGRLPL